MSAADKLAQVLAEHQSFTHAVERNVWVTRCECYEELPTPGIEYAYDALAAHQAAVVLAHLTAEGWAQGEAAPPEIRYATLTDGKTELDEVVARNAYVHLEAMADNAWWLSVESGGQMVHVNFGTKRAKITGIAEAV